MMTSTPLAPLPAMAPPDPARPRPPYRFIGTPALFGAALLTGGTVLHPAHADPGSPTAAFAEYADAGRGTWVAAHLLQLEGPPAWFWWSCCWPVRSTGREDRAGHG